MEKKAQIKVKLKNHKDNGGLRYLERGGTQDAPKADRHTQPAKTTRQQGCRHLVRPRKTGTPKTKSRTATAAEERGFDNEMQT